MDLVENKKIKICAITTISKTMDWFVCDIMKKLSENGYEVTLICNMEEGFAERHKDYANCIDLKMSRGVNIKDLLTIPFKFRKIFKNNRYDVIYYMSPNAAMYAALGGWLAHIPTRVYVQAGIRYISLTGMSRRIFKFIEKMTCSLSTNIRAVSPLNMQAAIDEKLCTPNKISIIGKGGTVGVSLSECDAFDRQVEREEKRTLYGVPLNAFVYGYVGRINADKGIGELIQAFEEIQACNPNVWLLLVGMLDEANPIPEEIMQRAKANSQIIFTGNVQPNQVYQHMAMFDVLTHPTYREGFGKVLQEAMGMRLPIITTNIPGPSEVVEENVSGILVEAKSMSELKEKMVLLLNDEQLRSSLAEAGRLRAEIYFDRPVMLQNQVDAMNQLINK